MINTLGNMAINSPKQFLNRSHSLTPAKPRAAGGKLYLMIPLERCYCQRSSPQLSS